MRFKGQITLEDFKKYHLSFSRFRYLLFFIILFAGFYFIKFGAAFAAAYGFDPLITNIAAAFSFSLIVTLILFVSYYFRIKPMYENDEALKMDQEYETTDGGILIKSVRGEHVINWADIKSVKYYKDFILINTGAYQAVLFPHRFFSSSGEIDEFKNIIGNKIRKSV